MIQICCKSATLSFIYFLYFEFHCHMSHCIRKPTKSLGENKGADQLRGNREADQRLCFRYTDSTISLLLKSEISSFWPASVTVQADLCRTWSEPKLLVFLRTGSYFIAVLQFQPINVHFVNYFIPQWKVESFKSYK